VRIQKRARRPNRIGYGSDVSQNGAIPFPEEHQLALNQELGLSSAAPIQDRHELFQSIYGLNDGTDLWVNRTGIVGCSIVLKRSSRLSLQDRVC